MKKTIIGIVSVVLLVGLGTVIVLTQKEEKIVEQPKQTAQTQEDKEFRKMIAANTYTGTKPEDFGKYKEVVGYMVKNGHLSIEKLKYMEVSGYDGSIGRNDSDVGIGLPSHFREMYQGGYDVEWVKQEPWYIRRREFGFVDRIFVSK